MSLTTFGEVPRAVSRSSKVTGSMILRLAHFGGFVPDYKSSGYNRGSFLIDAHTFGNTVSKLAIRKIVQLQYAL